MTIQKPDYYDDFLCIADKCSLTCCQEWKIYVDDNTLNNWGDFCNPCNDNKSLTEYVITHGNERVIKLTDEHKCPFLNDNKLCNLVCTYGDSILSDTCSSFPRQTHNFSDHTEYSLVSCCPVVIDKYNTNKAVSFITQFTEDISTVNNEMSPLFKLRNKMIAVIQDSKKNCAQSLLLIFYCLLEIYESNKLTKRGIEEFASESVLIKLSNVIENLPAASTDSLVECNELFLDLTDNYRKEGLYSSYLEPIAQKAEALESDYANTSLIMLWHKFHDEMQSYEQLFQNYLAAEIFMNVLLPDSELENMIVSFQWIGLEYSVMKQALFLKWLLDGQSISYETIRSYICVISRMTGYDEADYYEYLENSFEALIWDWGYFALITPL